MTNLALARKWRPRKFSDLIGQNTCVTILKNIIAHNKLHQAYLLTGTRGVGKTTIARIIAKALNCENLKNSEPCLSCKNCLSIEQGNFSDVIEIDAASNTGVDNIRELLDNAQYAPVVGSYKIYIIDEVHMLSKSAFNAMLKTLEEPPPHVVFILATTDYEKVPITILSRCLQLKLRNLLAYEISSHLSHILDKEQVPFVSDALDLIAQAANGSMRDGLSILDQAIAYTNNNINTQDIISILGITDDSFIYSILDNIISKNASALLEVINKIYNLGHDLENVLRNLSNKLCDISLVQLGALDNRALDIYAQQFSINDTQLYFEIANLGLEQLTKTSNKYQVAAMTVLRMLAFTIGTAKDKKILLKQSNFYTSPSVPTSPQSQLETITATPVSKNETIVDSSQVEQPSNNINTPQFDGDWINLIKQLEYTNIDNVVAPFLVNARLESYTHDLFNLTIDSQYQQAFNPQILDKLNTCFSRYFQRQIKFNIIFAANIDNTLKEERQLAIEQKHSLARESIAKDDNLNKLCALFSATITPESIKPI